MSDAAARTRAAHEYGRNLVVVAGAGSGKTSLLVERIVCQMMEGGLAHDAFAAITFTEKAAAEMRKRLEAALVRLAALANASAGAEELELRREADRAYGWLRERVPPAELVERARRAVHALPEMELTTIHGFCARILRRHPLEAGVSPDFRVDTGDRVDALVDELWERFLAGSEGVDGPLRARFARVLQRLGLGELESLARAAASFAVHEAALDSPLPSAARVFGDWARRAEQRIGEQLPSSPAKGPQSWLAAARAPLAALRDPGLEGLRRELGRARYESATKGVRGLLDGAAPTSNKARDAERLAKELYERFDKLREVDDALLGEALELLRPFGRAVRNEARRSGLLPFDALLALARDLLAEHPEVRDQVARRYRVLFLDEFQDTDPLQYEIVFLVAGAPGEPPPPGSLFIVGDPKQAIYRFRGADIAAYESAVERVLAAGGAREVLTANFRSVPEVLEPLDRLFQRSFAPPAGLEGAAAAAYARYHGLSAARPRADEPRVERWRIGEAASARDSRELEAEVIAGWIASEAAAGRVAPGDVALLLRALTDAHVYVRALQQRGIEVWVGRAEEPDREPAFQQVTSLLRALANPADAPAVVGFLRSPLGGVPDAELAAHATLHGGRWLYTTAAPAAPELANLARAFALLSRWHARVRSEPLAQVLAALRDETPLLALHAAARDGTRRLADLSALLDRLTARAAASPDLELARLVRSLQREEQRRSSEEPVPDSDAVRVLSIHAAKGLEFRCVILPDLARGALPDRGDEQGVDLRFAREQGALAVRTRAAVSSSWVAREALEKAHRDAELRRLLYVGATRARERLVFADAQRKQAPRQDTIGHLIADWRGDPGVVEREILEPARQEVAAPAPSAGDWLGALERTRAAAERAGRQVQAALLRPSAAAGADEEHAQPDAGAEELDSPWTAARRPVAQAVGTALHELFERWDFRGKERARALLGAALVRAAQRAGADEAAVCSEGEAVLESLLAGGLPHALAEVEVLGRELPLLFREDDGKAWSGTIDLLYRDPVSGRLVVADYKSDKRAEPEARARYRAQLEVYARGVARLFPGEPRPELELVWLRSGQRERLG